MKNRNQKSRDTKRDRNGWKAQRNIDRKAKKQRREFETGNGKGWK